MESNDAINKSTQYFPISVAKYALPYIALFDIMRNRLMNKSLVFPVFGKKITLRSLKIKKKN